MPGVGNSRIWASHTLVGEPCFMISICHLGTTNLHLHITSQVWPGSASCWETWTVSLRRYDLFAYFLNITELYRLGILRSCIMISGEGTH